MTASRGRAALAPTANGTPTPSVPSAVPVLGPELRDAPRQDVAAVAYERCARRAFVRYFAHGAREEAGVHAVDRCVALRVPRGAGRIRVTPRLGEPRGTRLHVPRIGQLPEHCTGVAEHGQVGRAVAAEGFGAHVDLHDLLVRGEERRTAEDQVPVEARAADDNDVCQRRGHAAVRKGTEAGGM
jgi:hypothetical protein